VRLNTRIFGVSVWNKPVVEPQINPQLLRQYGLDPGAKVSQVAFAPIAVRRWRTSPKPPLPQFAHDAIERN
jgi:hypothetical protein